MVRTGYICPLTLPVQNKQARNWPVIASRVVLVLIALLIAFFVYKAGIFSALVLRKPEPVANLPRPEQISSGKSSITGFDKEQQPYRFTAQSAIQDKKVSHLVHLEKVNGNFRKNDGEVLELTANEGQYDSQKKQLDLAGNIILVSKDRYTAFMKKATVTLKDRRLVSSAPVRVVFDRGEIKARGVEITDNGKHVLFVGRVKTTIQPPGQNTLSKENRQ